MDTRAMAVFAITLDRLSKSVGNAIEALEPHSTDSVIAEYLANLADVKTELDGTVYTVEATLEGMMREGIDRC